MRTDRDRATWRTCACPGCGNTFPAVTKKPQGGGTASKRHCSFACQQRAYRIRRRERLKATVEQRKVGP